MIYFFLLFYIIFLSYKYDILQHKRNKLLSYRVLLVLLILVAGLRYRVGSDTIVYMGTFKYIPPIDNIFSVGLDHFIYRPLWMIYISFFKYLGSFYLLQLSNAIILNCVYFAYARKHTENYFTFILFYYILFYIGLNFEFMREALAASVAIWGYKYWEEKKWAKFYFIAFICFNIHDSSIILFLFPLFKYIHINVKWGSILLVVFCILSLTFKSYLEPFGIWLMNIFSGSNSIDKFNVYINMDNYYNINYYINFWYIPLFLIPVLIMYVKYKMKREIKNLNILYLFSFLGVLMAFMSVLGRLSNYFTVFVLVFLADFMVRYVQSKQHKQRFLSMLFVLMITIPSLFISYQSRYGTVRFYNKYYPYSSIFNEFQNPERESTANGEDGFFIIK